MMKLLIFSDSHGDTYRMRELIARYDDVNVVCHLGDGEREFSYLQSEFPDKTFYGVRGNCDLASDAPALRLEILGGKRVLMTHGHLHGVKGGVYRYSLAAKEQNADLALFGHTHIPYEGYDDGLYLLNPGSIREGRYGMVDISPAGIVTRLLRF